MSGRAIGVFGGTFDPPHIGHLILAAAASEQLGLARLLWVLTPDPPHKQGWDITPLPIRLEMLQAAIGADPAFELSRVDIDRPSPHYAADTVRILKAQMPGERLIYLMGGDSLHDLPTWRSPRAFVNGCDAIAVMRRPEDVIDLPALEAKLPGLTARVTFLDAPLIEISSQEIRRRAGEGKSFRYFVPPEVYRIIQARGLYRSAG